MEGRYVWAGRNTSCSIHYQFNSHFWLFSGVLSPATFYSHKNVWDGCLGKTNCWINLNYILISLSLSLFYPHLRTCFLILEGGEEGEEGVRESERERNIHEWPLTHTPTGAWTQNLGLYPDRKLNLWPFSLQNNTPTKWATPARAHCTHGHMELYRILDHRLGDSKIIGCGRLKWLQNYLGFLKRKKIMVQVGVHSV